MSQITDHSKQWPPVLPRVLHAFVHDSGFAIARDRAAARRGADGNLAQVQKEAEQRAAEPGARVIAYEQSEEEKRHVPIPEDVQSNEGAAAAAAHRPTEPGEDDDEPDKDNVVRGLVVELARSLTRLAISVAKNGVPRPTPPVRTKDATTRHLASAADIADARRAGAGKAVDEANTRVTDGTDPLKEAGFEVPLRYVWDSISARYRIY